MLADKHRYEYEIATNSAPERVIRFVGREKTVLELGCGPGVITQQLRSNGCHVVGLEVDESAIAIVREYANEIYRCDLNAPNWPETLPPLGKFDVIVAADVFEHLYSPWDSMKQLHRYLSDSGCLVVSVPHVGHAAIVASLLNSDFDYRPWGLLDSTHIRFFGLFNLQTLFEGASFKIVEVDFVVVAPENTELSNQWERIPKDTQRIIRKSRFSSIYQLVIRAVPIDRPGEALNLTSLKIPKAVGLLSKLKRTAVGGKLASLIPSSARKRLSDFARKKGI